MENRKDIVFFLFISAVLILSILYFSVPERVLFMENEIRWWNEFMEVVKRVFS
jgi:hypothetical protein